MKRKVTMKFKLVLKREIAMGPRLYFWLLLIVARCPLTAMQKPDQIQIHFEIRNNSAQAVTVLFDVKSFTAQFVVIRPDEIRSETPYPKVPIILTSNGMRLATSGGHFAIDLEADRSILMGQAKKYDDETGSWKRIQGGIPTAYVKRGNLTINQQGDPYISVYAEPDDGRPAVSYDVYEKLMGKKECGSPAQILGASLDTNLKKAYREKMALWHPDRNKSPEAEDAFKLINWAAEKLKAK